MSREAAKRQSKAERKRRQREEDEDEAKHTPACPDPERHAGEVDEEGASPVQVDG